MCVKVAGTEWGGAGREGGHKLFCHLSGAGEGG